MENIIFSVSSFEIYLWLENVIKIGNLSNILLDIIFKY